jgi:hypothetical protein
MDIGFARNVLSNFKRRSFGETLSYSLGRFHIVRRAYGLGVGMLQRQRGTASMLRDEPSIFPPLAVDSAVRSIDDTALFAGLFVPRDIVEGLTAYARSTPLRPPTKTYAFRYDDVNAGRVPNGDPAILAIVVGADHHPLVRRIAEDPQVYEVVRRYLGYNPLHLNIRLMWSFVSDAPDPQRAAASQTIAYHFDVHHYNFIYANYYITDCDARSGAHAMILTSHRDKPISWMLGSVRQDGEVIRRHYGAANELVIEGPAGYGFIQDASCYHKALPPIERERLMLQIRYF